MNKNTRPRARTSQYISSNFIFTRVGDTMIPWSSGLSPPIRRIKHFEAFLNFPPRPVVPPRRLNQVTVSVHDVVDKRRGVGRWWRSRSHGQIRHAKVSTIDTGVIINPSQHACDGAGRVHRILRVSKRLLAWNLISWVSSRNSGQIKSDIFTREGKTRVHRFVRYADASDPETDTLRPGYANNATSRQSFGWKQVDVELLEHQVHA